MMARQRRQPLWARRETWFILFCAVVVALIVLAAIGYYSGRWDQPVYHTDDL